MNYEKINAEAIKACVKCGFIPVDTPAHRSCVTQGGANGT